MKHSEEYERFTAYVDRVLAVPHSVIKQRVEEERKVSAMKTVRPGPKPKKKAVKPPSSVRDSRESN
jgi:hypothetical protein